jgi:hypothetical protein
LAEGLRKRKQGREFSWKSGGAPMTKSSTFALVAVLVLGPLRAAAEPANTLQSMFGELNQCMATVRLSKGTDVTVQFMLNRRGGLIGKPRITHAQWVGSEADRKAAAASIAEGFDKCMPVSITDTLGGAIAGRLIAYRLRGGTGREDKV